MKLVNFKLEEDFIAQIEEEVKNNSLNKSEFYRACLERGFQEITHNIPKKDKHLIAFYIDDSEYKKLLDISKKYKIQFQKTFYATFGTGFDVLKALNFAGFLHLAKGLITIEDAVKKILKK